jgi:uncharacterized protein (TIGR02677 family)
MSPRPWRSVDPDLFRFTTTDLRELHIGIMAAFEWAGVLSPVLRLDGVRRALREVRWDEPVGDEQLVAALGSLTGWGLLDASQDHAADYATPEEFERKNLQWSLSSRGEAAVSGLFAALDALARTASLQPAVLDAIGDALQNVADLLDRPADPSTDGDLHLQLVMVETHLAGLVANVRQFNTHLQRLVQADDDDAVFAEVKQRTVTYLQEFVDGVDRPRRRIAATLGDIDGRTATLFDRAAAGARLAPVAGDDPVVAYVAERQRHWDALTVWFSPTDGAEPRVLGLIGVARAAINELLRVLERRWEERRRSASVARDLRNLATRFADAPTEDDAHRLFHAAFGMWSARHDHLRAADDDPRQPRRRFGETEPVVVAPSLRTTGSLAQRGRSRPVADPVHWREQRRRVHAEALAAQEELRRSVVTDGEVRLSHLPRLDPEVFTELLGLLARALDAPANSDGRRRAMSIDGQVEVVLGPSDSTTTVITTPTGVFGTPNFTIEITISDDRVARTEEAR